MDAKTNQIIIDCLKAYDPREIGVFGSYARGEMNNDSDIDILYSLDKKISLFDIVQIKLDLEEKLNRKNRLYFQKRFKRMDNSLCNERFEGYL